MCEHCRRMGHMKEKCWILFPHPKTQRNKGQEDRITSNLASTSNNNAKSTNNSIISMEDLAQQVLQHLSKSGQTDAMANIATDQTEQKHTGKI